MTESCLPGFHRDIFCVHHSRVEMPERSKASRCDSELFEPWIDRLFGKSKPKRLGAGIEAANLRSSIMKSIATDRRVAKEMFV